MKIRRSINGENMEIELTQAEMWSAYEEQQHKFDMSDIDCVFDYKEYGFSEAEAEHVIAEMAYRMRRYIDKYDCDFAYARDEAISDVLREHGKEAV